MSHTRLTPLAVLLLDLSPSVLFEKKKKIVSALVLECPLEYFDGT